MFPTYIGRLQKRRLLFHLMTDMQYYDTLFELSQKTEFITKYNKKFAKSRVHSLCFNLEMKSDSLKGMVRMSPSSIIADFKTFFDRYSFGVVVTTIIRWVGLISCIIFARSRPFKPFK